MNLTDRYDEDCVEAAEKLARKLARTTSANAAALICAAFKEYACEHDKRMTADRWAQQYKSACITISYLHDALTEIENRLKQQVDAGTGTHVEEKCLAAARAGLAHLK